MCTLDQSSGIIQLANRSEVMSEKTISAFLLLSAIVQSETCRLCDYSYTANYFHCPPTCDVVIRQYANLKQVDLVG